MNFDYSVQNNRGIFSSSLLCEGLFNESLQALQAIVLSSSLSNP